MRKHYLWLCFILLIAAPASSAQTIPLKVCVSQGGNGYDALQLAGELSSRKQESGSPIAVVAITGKALSVREERELADTSAPFERVVVKEKTLKARSDEIERLKCDYDIQVWHQQGAVAPEVNGAVDNPSTIQGVPETVSYELRKAGSKKVLARGVAPPRTVFVKQGRRLFSPYSLFADDIVKKLSSVR